MLGGLEIRLVNLQFGSLSLLCRIPSCSSSSSAGPSYSPLSSGAESGCVSDAMKISCSMARSRWSVAQGSTVATWRPVTGGDLLRAAAVAAVGEWLCVEVAAVVVGLGRWGFVPW